jgi:hypothetical protein
MNEIIQLTRPAIEPVTALEAMVQLGLGTPVDAALNTQLVTQITRLLLAARRYCENLTRTTLITTSWLRQMDSWPGWDSRRAHNYLEGFLLPKPPFQSITSFKYVDENGTLQNLAWDTSYGANVFEPMYGYQLDPGADTRPARLLPRWATPWPPLRLVANAVQIVFKNGYGGPVTASMLLDSAILTGPVFNPGDVGQQVNVPTAAGSGNPLCTTIASVDENGQATLAAPALAEVAASTNNVWVGHEVPQEIKLAMMLATQFYFEQGATTDLPMPRVVDDLLEMYRDRS